MANPTEIVVNTPFPGYPVGAAITDAGTIATILAGPYAGCVVPVSLGGNGAEALTVGVQQAYVGLPILLAGSIENGAPIALDYSIDGGNTWSPVTSYVLTGANWTGNGPLYGAPQSGSIIVRDHAATAVQSASANFTVTGPSSLVIGPPGPPGGPGSQGNQGPPVVQSLLTMLGGWNASTNTPALASSGGTNNTGYYVTTAGTTSLNGVSSWAVNDVVAFVGGAWIKLAGYAAASAVASLTVTGNLAAAGMTISSGMFSHVWSDAQGYVSAYIDNSGVFRAANANLSSLTTAQATVAALSAGGSTISSGMFAYVWPDAQGYASLYMKNNGSVIAANLQTSIFNNFTVTSNSLFPFAVTDGGYMGLGVRYDGLVIGRGIDPANTPPLAQYNFDTSGTYFAVLKGVKRLRLFYFDGQSNNVGFNQTTDALLSPTPLYPSNAFMLNNVNGGSPRASGIPSAGFVPLCEVLTDASARESKASSAINNTLSMLAAIGDTNEYFLASIGAQSGHSIELLTRGTQQDIDLLQFLQDAKRLGAANGFDEVVLEAYHMHQGEANTAEVNAGTWTYGFGQEAFASYHEAHWWKACDDIKRILRQSRDPIFYVTFDGTVSNASAFEQPIFRAWNDLRSRIPNMRIVGSNYHSQRWQPIATYTAGALHSSSLGQNRLGVDVARAYIQEEFGVGWSDMRITEVRWVDQNGLGSNTKFTARMFCPLLGVPVLDTSENVVATVANGTTGALAIAGYYGLVFDDASGAPPTITSSVFGTGANANDVTFTLSAPPAGYGPCRLAGGTQASAGAAGLTGPLVGPRLAFRGSVGTPSVSESGAVQYPWLTPFVMSIGRP